MADVLEKRMRRIVRARMTRGQRDAVAAAAGHPDGSWVSNWLSGAQKHAHLDEIAAMLTALRVDLGRALTVPSGADDDLDWEVFGEMGKLKTPEQKALALRLVRSVHAPDVAPRSIRPTAANQNREANTAPGRRKAGKE